MKVFLILYMYIISNPYRNEYLIKIDTPSKYEILNLQKKGIEIWFYNNSFAIGCVSDDKLNMIPKYEILDKNPRNKKYFIVRVFQDIKSSCFKDFIEVLWKKDNLYIIKAKGDRPPDCKIKADVIYIRQRNVRVKIKDNTEKIKSICFKIQL